MVSLYMESWLARFRAQLAEGEASDRSFGLVVGAIFFVIGLLPLIRGGHLHLWAVVLGVVLILTAAIYPMALRWPKRAWLLLGFLMGLIINPIVLGILFFLVIAPLGLLMRAFGRDPLRLHKPPDLVTYWRIRSEPVSDMNDQF